jgi:carbonic anhydrase
MAQNSKMEQIAISKSTAMSQLALDAQILVTCSDPRVVPEKFFQLNGVGTFQSKLWYIVHANANISSDASVTRITGGRVNDAIRSLIVMDGIMPIKHVIIIGHTGIWCCYNANKFTAFDLRHF